MLNLSMFRPEGTVFSLQLAICSDDGQYMLLILLKVKGPTDKPLAQPLLANLETANCQLQTANYSYLRPPYGKKWK